MTDEELEDASEVFRLPSGGYLVVEGQNETLRQFHEE